MSLQFDNKISLGHVLSIGLIIFGGITAYADLRGAQAQLSLEFASITRSAAERETRIRAVEIAQATQSSDLRSIYTGISDIKAQLSKMQEMKQ